MANGGRIGQNRMFLKRARMVIKSFYFLEFLFGEKLLVEFRLIKVTFGEDLRR